MTETQHTPRVAVTGMWSNQVHGLRFDGNAVATAVLLFAETNLTARQRLRDFDALLVPGGSDVDPARYGEEPHETTSTADFAAQDQFEADMMAAAIDLGIPVLAICRGFQLLNIEQGGSLVQDVPADSVHRNSVHEVTVEADSELASVLEVTSLSVSSYHHQALGRLGDGLRVTATAEDGIIEAVELVDTRSPLLAIQWHPEDTAAGDPRQHALFQWLADQAREYRATHKGT
jgi:putative glutamine amidotransferase